MSDKGLATHLKQEVIAAIDHWENNLGSMDFLICDYLWPVLQRMIAAEAARIAKEARVEALREAQNITDDEGCPAASKRIQALIDSETAQKGE